MIVTLTKNSSKYKIQNYHTKTIPPKNHNLDYIFFTPQRNYQKDLTFFDFMNNINSIGNTSIENMYRKYIIRLGEIKMNTDTIIIHKIHFASYTLEFNEPFTLKYILKDGIFIYDNKELECYIAGESIKELKESFYEDIVVSWKLYVECDISELDSGAIELRNNLERLLVRVQ